MLYAIGELPEKLIPLKLLSLDLARSGTHFQSNIESLVWYVLDRFVFPLLSCSQISMIKVPGTLFFLERLRKLPLFLGIVRSFEVSTVKSCCISSFSLQIFFAGSLLLAFFCLGKLEFFVLYAASVSVADQMDRISGNENFVFPVA